MVIEMANVMNETTEMVDKYIKNLDKTAMRVGRKLYAAWPCEGGKACSWQVWNSSQHKNRGGNNSVKYERYKTNFKRRGADKMKSLRLHSTFSKKSKMSGSLPHNVQHSPYEDGQSHCVQYYLHDFDCQLEKK